ncbi:hypothetical protein Anas_06643 [Armadillidium nasatum]|uniref:Uncharacterized protein n=1 Tax=Armadillidium nasatum TaxID=96803 RepID=A0A5N5TCS3_9CRUS|nr:hypothetical protein Anas_06643 [Armadillidium nasatum]
MAAGGWSIMECLDICVVYHLNFTFDMLTVVPSCVGIIYSVFYNVLLFKKNFGFCHFRASLREGKSSLLFQCNTKFSKVSTVGGGYAELPLDADALQRLENVLHTEEAKQILGGPLLDIVKDPTSDHLEKLISSSSGWLRIWLLKPISIYNSRTDTSLSTEKKKRPPPKRRSQRQMDKAEREEMSLVVVVVLMTLHDSAIICN